MALSREEYQKRLAAVRRKNQFDLETTEGLYNLTQLVGGEVGQKADALLEKDESPFRRLWDSVKGGVGKAFDILQRPNFAVASATKNLLDDDYTTTFLEGAWTGITGRTKHTFFDVMTEQGWEPESRLGRGTKATTGFALDVLLDPTTYITFGAASGIKLGGRVLNKTGREFLQKGLEMGAGKEFGEEFVRKSLEGMIEKSPELYAHFVDHGGIKFFGQTLVAGSTLSATAKALPFMSKLDAVTEPARRTLYALFNRDASAKYGKLPDELIQIKQKYLDLGVVGEEDAQQLIRAIAKANNLTTQEMELVLNQIEKGLPFADERLNNVKRLIENAQARARRNELRAGISVQELPNYVLHSRMGDDVKMIPFKPGGGLPKLGAAEERQILKFVSEDGKRSLIGDARKLKLKPVQGIKGFFHELTTGEFNTLKDIENVLAKNGYKIRYKPQAGLRGGGVAGYFDPTRKEIVIATKTPTVKDVVDVLKHEITHNAHFNIAGKIEVFETFSGKGGRFQEAAKVLDNAKTVAKEEWEKILEANGISKAEFKAMSAAKKAYYKKPTELLAYAVSALQKNPARAKKLFPETAAALEELSSQNEIFNLLNKEVAPSGRTMTGRVYTDEAGEFFFAENAAVSEINEAFGEEFFDPNIVTAATARLVASERAVTARNFYREVAQKFGAPASHAPSNYVEAGVKGLENFRFHPAVAEELGTFKKTLINDEATNSLLRVFDRIQNYWKASVTSIFPAFHGRNAISNVFLSYGDIGAASLSPGKHALAVQIRVMSKQFDDLFQKSLGIGDEAVKAREELVELAKKVVIQKDGRGKSWTFGDLRRVLRDNRVALRDEFVGHMDTRDDILRRASQITDGKAKRTVRALNPLSSDNIVYRAGRRVGNSVEQQARIVHFLAQLQKTGDVQLAAQRVKQFLFDYQNLSTFEKGVMRRLVPFYTFTRKNMEQQVRLLITRPRVLVGQAKLVSSASDYFAAGGLTEEERSNLDEFLQEGLGIVYKRDGKEIEVINQVGLPVENFLSLLQSDWVLGQLSPAIKTPLELALGKSIFYDQDVEELNDGSAWVNAPDFIKDYLGYIEVESFGRTRPIVLNATRAYLIRQLPPTSRVISVIDQLQKENISGRVKLLQHTTGLKPYGRDLEIRALVADKERYRELQDLLEDAGIAPVFKKSFIPKDRELKN